VAVNRSPGLPDFSDDGPRPQARAREMAAILASLHMRTADDLFGGPEGSPRTDRLIAASIQWAERIMEQIDSTFGKS